MSIATNNDVRWLDFATDEDWLKHRVEGIGASEAGAILGVSPWKTPLQVFLEKSGQVPSQKASPRMKWGLKLERLIAEDYAEESGLPLAKPKRVCYLERSPWMLASLDYWVPQDRVVEIKTVSPFGKDGFGEDESDQVPEHYALQCQQQMACSGLERADLVALYLGSYTVHVFHLVRNQDLIDKLEDAEWEFMQRVKRGDMPLPDWTHPSTAEILALLEPTAGEVAVLGDAELAMADEYQRLGEESRAMEAKRKELKARLILAMGEAAEGDLPDGRTVRRKMIERAAYSVEATSFYDFRILKGRK